MDRVVLKGDGVLLFEEMVYQRMWYYSKMLRRNGIYLRGDSICLRRDGICIDRIVLKGDGVLKNVML